MTVHTALGAARLTGRATSGLTAYVWAWRSFTVPFALFLVWAYILVPAWGPAAWVLLAAGFLLGFASMMDHGSGFSLDAFVHHIDGAMERTRRRHHATRLRRRWPEVTRQLGWDAADGKAPTTNTGRPVESRRMKPRSPALRHIEHLGDTIRVAWRPRGDVAAKQYREHAEALRRELRGHSVRFAEDPAEPGTLVATIGMTPLPVRDDAPGPVDGQAAAPLMAGEPLAVQQATTDPDVGPHLAIELGQRAGGGVARWVPGEVNGLLITGSTGGGKGGALRYLTHQCLEQGAVVHVLDPKGTGEHAWVTDYGGHLHRGVERQLETLRVTTMELRARCDDLAALGAEKVGDLPARLRPQPIVVVVDEAADLLTLRRVATEKATDDLRAEAGALLTLLAQQGRAAWIHPVVALQRPDVAALGPAGGALRAQLVARVVTGTIDEDGLDQALGNGHREHLVHLTGHPGRALVTRLNHADGGDPYSIQVRWLPVTALRPVGVNPPGRRAA
ncbi:MAG: hypothetical protein U0237_20110 [Thermoleophilia bacterium]